MFFENPGRKLALACLTPNSVRTLRRNLKEASEGAGRRLGSREFHTEVTAVEKARDAKIKRLLILRTEKLSGRLTVWTVVQRGMVVVASV